MKNVFEYYDEGVYLAHHGIKGQKWGIRRFQNPDGSLTEVGKQRYLKAATDYLDPKAKRINVKYTNNNGKSYYLNTTEGYAQIRKYIEEASTTSKELSKIIDEARKLNSEEDTDGEAWMNDQDRVRKTTKDYLSEKREKEIKGLEDDLEYVKNRKIKRGDEEYLIDHITQSLESKKKEKITKQYVDEYIKKNGGIDFYSDMWAYEKKKHPNMVARDDRIFELSQEYRTESEKYFKELLGEYGNKRIPTSRYGTTLSSLLSERSSDAFWDLMWGWY